jgi:aspartate/methionine/tyrosine aminotransferase
MAIKLPAHIAFNQTLPANLPYKLSSSGAQTRTLAQLMTLASDEETSAIYQQTLSYAAIAGGLPLRQAIVDFHLSSNVTQLNTDAVTQLTANNVLCFCGAQEALAAVYQAVLADATVNDEVIVFTPCYPSLMSMIEQYGASVVSIALSFEQQWEMAFERLAAKVNKRTKMIVINSPHNPTGATCSAEFSAKLIALARKFDCYILSDDVSQASYLNTAELQQQTAHTYLSYEKAIVIGVMSKSFGLAGIRVGWLLSANNALVNDCLAIKCVGSICCSVIDEQLALIALGNASKILSENNRIIESNIKLFQQFVDKNNAVLQWHAPKAGLMALVKVNLPFSIECWAKEIAEKFGLHILPSSLFNLQGNYFRLGLGAENLSEALIVFQQAIDDVNYKLNNRVES